MQPTNSPMPLSPYSSSQRKNKVLSAFQKVEGVGDTHISRKRMFKMGRGCHVKDMLPRSCRMASFQGRDQEDASPTEI